jgi:hypothetical protein
MMGVEATRCSLWRREAWLLAGLDTDVSASSTRPPREEHAHLQCTAVRSLCGLELICLQMVWTGGITPLGRGVRRRRKVGYRHFGPVGVVRYLPRSGARS